MKSGDSGLNNGAVVAVSLIVTSIRCRVESVSSFEPFGTPKSGSLNWFVQIWIAPSHECNSIQYCIELHCGLKWADVKNPNQADQGRHPRKAVRSGGACLRGTGHRARQHRGDRGGGGFLARGVLFE